MFTASQETGDGQHSGEAYGEAPGDILPVSCAQEPTVAVVPRAAVAGSRGPTPCAADTTEVRTPQR
jgi:hypothetical protein